LTEDIYFINGKNVDEYGIDHINMVGGYGLNQFMKEGRGCKYMDECFVFFLLIVLYTHTNQYINVVVQ